MKKFESIRGISLHITELEALLNNIDFTDFFVEATFQFTLLMELTSLYDKKSILPERSIKHYKLKNLVKKRIDIVVEDVDYVAIELKMPMNGQVPEQMFKFIEDIKFLEQLKSSSKFTHCFFITVTNDQNFWIGRENDGIYSFFRGNKKINGKIYKPTGENKNNKFYEIKNEYNVDWKALKNNFSYFIIKI